MQIDIRSRGFTLTPALGEYTERRLRFALVHAGDRVRRVAVRLFDVHDPRGGIAKRCRIQVTLNGLAAVVIEDAEADLYLAIDRAADRVGRTVARRLDANATNTSGTRSASALDARSSRLRSSEK